MSFSLPPVPVVHKHFVAHLASQPDALLRDLVKPYNEYEARLREAFAQDRDHPSIQDAHVNAVPIFTGQEHTLTIRARDPQHDPEAERYIMPLKPKVRRANGSPAMVRNMKEFKENFDLFSERSLVDLDWNNVVVAGSSVVTAMLPVPKKYATSKRALRQYYHQKLAPSSDVDIFLWGLDEQAAIAKIAQIEECVRNSILAETTTIRTKNAITIASQYPTRHIQIVLRLYKSVSEILTGFDVDCSCFAFDGNQVYATPRGITSFCSQVNTIDLSRRSPSYESRLAKYAHRGFEVYFADLDRKRIDPTLYDRSFVRTMGLARLLMLERLPKESDRDAYLNQRRQERGRPMLDLWRNKRRQLPGNMKDRDPEDIAEWDLEADVSNYHTFTVPYGPKYHAKKIERRLYIKDLLLNAEWNHKKDRTVNLHRHPCFIGDVAHIVNDCCGECPEPKSDEEIEVAEEERKIYVHGGISFMKDNPGRQAIGSFHPLTADDWTDMAYLGNTQELCTAIINADAAAVTEWCSREGNDVNKRDHTGRTPLQLAVLCGNIEIMKILIEKGARIIARIADGFTALHMAAALGRADMIKLLAAKSSENEELEAEKQDARKAERQRKKNSEVSGDTQMTEAQIDEESDAEMIDADEDERDDDAMTQGSFVKVKKEDIARENVAEDGDVLFGPDVYDANLLAWDAPVSPLHIAILAGQVEAIEALATEFGADVLMPVKLKNNYDGKINAAILNLVLASSISDSSKIPAVVKKLLTLGAKPSQSDVKEVSALHGAVILNSVEALKVMMEEDMPASKAAINHLSRSGHTSWYQPQLHSPLLTAIRNANAGLVDLLLEAGASPTITYEAFREAYLRLVKETAPHVQKIDEPQLRIKHKAECEQPIIAAAASGIFDIIKALLRSGVDVNAVDMNGGKILGNEYSQHLIGQTALDIVRKQIEACKAQHQKPKRKEKMLTLRSDDEYLQGLRPGTYQYTIVLRNLEIARLITKEFEKDYSESCKQHATNKETQNEDATAQLEELEMMADEIVRHGGKGFYDLHPHKTPPPNNNDIYNYVRNGSSQDDHSPEEKEPPHYEIKLTFKDPRIDETKKAAYLKLFNAVWEGDAETVKELTLRPIDVGDGKEIPPIPIAISDSSNVNPLGIAVAKRNFQLARTILDIAAAQFQPNKEKKSVKFPRRRFRIQSAMDEADDEPEDSTTADDILVTSELINDEFTIDDLRQLSQTVGSDVDPREFLTWRSSVWAVNDRFDVPFMIALKKRGGYPDSRANHTQAQMYYNMSHNTSYDMPYKVRFSTRVRSSFEGPNLLEYAAVNGDLETAKFLMKASRDFARKDEKDGSKSILKLGCWSPAQLHAAMAVSVECSKLDVAEFLIAESGAGMPIDELSKEVVIPEDEREKPKFYQGLKLYGMHKASWARQIAGENNDQQQHWIHSTPAPFLQAIYQENRPSMEFWQSDACIRMYEAFGERNQDVKEVQLLARKYGGWSNFVTSWIGLRRDLALHCAVIRGRREDESPESSESLDRMKYLMATVPGSLHAKSINGKDPLWLAFHHRQVENAKLFIGAGADQNTRDGNGMNIIHALLSQAIASPNPRREGAPPDPEEEKAKQQFAATEELLKLVDPRVLPALWTDRCSEGPSGLTPFALLINMKPPSIEYFQLLDKYMPTAEILSMFDGSGQTPLHRMVIGAQNKANRLLLRAILNTYPEFLALENASGQTPLDLASTFYVRERTNRAPEAPAASVPGQYMNSCRSNYRRLVRGNNQQPYHTNTDLEDCKPWQNVVYELLKEMTEEYTSKHGPTSLKRRMISVRDASEVAKRLAEKQKNRNQAHPSCYRRYRGRRLKESDLADDDEEVEEVHDEVERWMGGNGFNTVFNWPTWYP